jgi:hypothetical protein
MSWSRPGGRRAGAAVLVLVMGCGLVAASCSSGVGRSASGSSTSPSTTPAPSRLPTSAASPTTAGAGGSSTTTTAGRADGVEPTVGVSGAFGASGVGFGAVRPTEISLGGDPTGILTGITWQSWGGANATGSGTSTYVAPGQSVAQGTQETATVVASGLGTCKGAPAYQQVVWYFPQHGQTPADNGGSPIQACTGP